MTVVFEPRPSRYAVESWDQRVVNRDGVPERHEKWCPVRYFRHIDEASRHAQEMADKYPRQKWRVVDTRPEEA